MNLREGTFYFIFLVFTTASCFKEKNLDLGNLELEVHIGNEFSSDPALSKFARHLLFCH